jgi:hypothetical protein
MHTYLNADMKEPYFHSVEGTLKLEPEPESQLVEKSYINLPRSWIKSEMFE